MEFVYIVKYQYEGERIEEYTSLILGVYSSKSKAEAALFRYKTDAIEEFSEFWFTEKCIDADEPEEFTAHDPEGCDSVTITVEEFKMQ